MDIDISIEQLILHDIPIRREQRHLLQSALQTELARLLVEGGFTTRLADGSLVPYLTGSEISLPPGNAAPDPAQLGVQIAQAIYGGLSQ